MSSNTSAPETQLMTKMRIVYVTVLKPMIFTRICFSTTTSLIRQITNTILGPNKNVNGKMKEENGIPIREFVRIRPKRYSIKYGQAEKKAA